MHFYIPKEQILLQLTSNISGTGRRVCNTSTYKLLRPKEEGVAGDWGRLIMRSFVTWTLHQILLGWSNLGGWDEKCIQNFDICSWAFAATKFDEVFSGYQPRKVSVWNWHFEDHLGHHHHHYHQGSDHQIQILIGNPEGKRPLRRPRLRWKDNIKMDLWERVGSCVLDSSGSE
jgi:hypothetical protein